MRNALRWIGEGLGLLAMVVGVVLVVLMAPGLLGGEG